MAHEDFRRQDAVKTSSDRSFGFVFAGFFFIVSLFPLITSGGVRTWALIPAGLFLLVSLVRPGVLAPLNKLWTRFGAVLHRIVNPVVLGVMFFLVITPIGFVMRLIGKDLLRLKLEKSQDSYWIERTPPGPKPDSITDQF